MTEQPGRHRGPEAPDSKEAGEKKPNYGFINPAKIADLRVEEMRIVMQEEIYDDPDSSKSSEERAGDRIAQLFEDTLDAHNITDPEEREKFREALEHLSVQNMSSDAWQNEQTAGKHGGVHESGKALAEQLYEEYKQKTSEEEPANGKHARDTKEEASAPQEDTSKDVLIWGKKRKAETSEAAEDTVEKKKAEEAFRELFTPTAITHLRTDQYQAYQDEFAKLNATAADPFDLKGERNQEAMANAQSTIEKIIEDYLEDYADNENYAKALEYLRSVSVNAIEPSDWLDKRDVEGEDEPLTGPERAERFRDSLGKVELPQDPEADPQADPDSKPDLDPKPDEEKSDDGEKPPEKRPLLTLEQLRDMRSRALELGYRRDDKAQKLADLIAARMKKGDAYSEETQSELDGLYKEYKDITFEHNKLKIELKRDALNLDAENLTDEEREVRKQELLNEATVLTVESQAVLRQKVRDAYLSNFWRKRTARASELFNHESKKIRYGTRAALGAAALGITFVTWGGAGGFLTAAGAFKGLLAGGTSAYLRKSGKGPGLNAEGDFDMSKLKAEDLLGDDFEKLKDLNEKAAAALVGETDLERAKREEATSFKNIRNGALAGLAVGELVGLGVNTAQTLWDAPSDLRELMNHFSAHGPGHSEYTQPGGGQPPDITTKQSTGLEHLGQGSPSPVASPSGGLDSGGVGAGGGAVSGQEGIGGDVGGAGGEHVVGDGAGTSGPETSGNPLLDQYADNPEGAQDIILNEGPYQTFDQMGIPRSMWEELYKNPDLVKELQGYGDAYALDGQNNGFGWAHAGNLSEKSISAIYRHAHMLQPGRFGLAS